MNAADGVLLAVIGASALFGLVRGFIGVLASIAAWVLAGWGAFRFGAEVALMLSATGQPSLGQIFAGYALSFIAVLLVVGLVGWGVRKLAHSVGLSGMDRLLGLVLGLARGALIASGLVLLAGLTSIPREAEWRTSQVVPVLLPGAHWLSGWLPEWVAAQIDFSDGASAPSNPADGTLPLPAPVEPDGPVTT